MANEIEGLLDVHAAHSGGDAPHLCDAFGSAVIDCPGHSSKAGWNANCRMPLRALQRFVNRVSATLSAEHRLEPPIAGWLLSSRRARLATHPRVARSSRAPQRRPTRIIS